MCHAGQDGTRLPTLPKRLQPMLATLIDAPFDDPRLGVRGEWDGFAWWRGSRRAESHSIRATARSSATLHAGRQRHWRNQPPAVIDGELVALDENGISRFQLLQNALRTAADLRYCIFDLMALDGEDLRELPLRAQRAGRGRSCQRPAPQLQRSPAGARQAVFQGKQSAGAWKASWRSGRQHLLSGARSTRLAQDQGCQAPGSRDRRVHGAAALPPPFRRARPGGARWWSSSWRWVSSRRVSCSRS